MGLSCGAYGAGDDEQYRTPGGVALGPYPDIVPVVRSEKWNPGEGDRIQTLPGRDRMISSEEEQSRPVLDLRRRPSSQGFGEQPADTAGTHLMIGNEWEIIWRERREQNQTPRPRRWKYQYQE